MGEGRALRPARRAAGVEQPRRVAGRQVRQRHRGRRHEPRPVRPRGDDDLAQGRQLAEQGPHVVLVLGVGDDDGRRAVPQDVRQLLAVQPGVDRDGAQPRVPDPEQRLEVLRAVAHDDRDPVPRYEAGPGAQAAGDVRDGRGPGRPGRVDALALGDRRGVRAEPAVPLHPHSKVHRCLPASLTEGPPTAPGRIVEAPCRTQYQRFLNAGPQPFPRSAEAGYCPAHQAR